MAGNDPALRKSVMNGYLSMAGALGMPFVKFGRFKGRYECAVQGEAVLNDLRARSRFERRKSSASPSTRPAYIKMVTIFGGARKAQ